MSIAHVYSQTVADGTATSVVRPSDWNSNHNMVLNIGGNTAGTSQISGQDIVWVGGNNVTLSANGSTVSIVGPNTVAQSVQTQASGNIAGAGYTFTTQAGTSIGATHNSAGLSLAQPLFITTAANSTHSHNFATTTTGGSNIVVGTANSAGATIGVPSFLTTAALSQNTSNYAGIGTTYAGTNVNATMAVGTNGVALSLSAAGGGTINQTGPNIAVAGSTVTSGDVLFSNANGVTFGMAGSTITASVAAGGGGAALTLSNFMPFSNNVNNTTLSQPGQNSLYLQHMFVPGYVSMSNIEFYARGTFASSTNAMSAFQTIGYALYSQDTGTNNTRMTLAGSSSALYQASFNSSTAAGFTFAAGGTSFSTSTNNTSIFSGLSGAFHLYLPFATMMSPNVKYAVGLLMSSTTTGGTAAPRLSGIYHMTVMTSNMGRLAVTGTNAASSTVIGDYDMGIYGTTTGAFPNSYATSQMGIAVNRAKLFMQLEV